MRNVYIGFGSNLGNREGTINSAITALESELAEIRRIKSLTQSNIYETEAWGMPECTPSFLNCVVCIETDLELLSLLEVLLKIEIYFGRDRNEEEDYSSRTLDLDILCSENEVINSKKLQVPHPRISSRRFVLEPLNDLDPNLQIPNTEGNVSELLANCPLTPKVKQWMATHT